MQRLNLIVFVEGPTDKIIVTNLLHAARLTEGVQIEICGGKNKIAKHIAGMQNSVATKYIALIDADELSTADSQALAQQQLGYPNIPVFCAVPTIEAWLFADDVAARAAARNAHAAQTLGRAALPESIPYPKQLAFNVFAKTEPAFAFLSNVDLDRATARSPSLRAFLIGVADSIGRDLDFETASLSSSIGRDAFSAILRELPGSSVAWKTLDGTEIRAAELARAVAEGEEIGKQYVTEVLRIARDIVARKSRR